MAQWNLFAALARLEFARRRYLRSYFQTLNIPLGQGQPRILSHLLCAGASSQKALAEACAIDESTLSRSIDRLVDAGLVVRSADPECRRSLRVSLTDDGKAAAEKISAALEHTDEILRGALRGRSEDALVAMLTDMAEALSSAQQYDPDAST